MKVFYFGRIIFLSTFLYTSGAFAADLNAWNAKFDDFKKSLATNGINVEAIEFRKPDMIPFGGLDIANLFAKFPGSADFTFLGVVTLKEGLMFPPIEEAKIFETVQTRIQQFTREQAQKGLVEQLPKISLFAADHLDAAKKFYEASLKDPPHMRMKDPTMNAAAFAQNIMNNAGFPVQIQGVEKIDASQATLPVSMSTTSIHKIVFKHLTQTMTLAVELHTELSDDVPRSTQKVLDIAEGKLLSRYVDALPFLIGNLKNRGMVILMTENRVPPLPQEIMYSDLQKHPLFSQAIKQLPEDQARAVQSLFGNGSKPIGSEDFGKALNSLFVEFKDGGGNTDHLFLLSTLFKTMKIVRAANVCEYLAFGSK